MIFKFLKFSNRSFTLIEFLIASFLIVILFLLSLPIILRIYININEASAITTLGKLSAAFEVYRTLYKTYPRGLTDLEVVNPTLGFNNFLSSGESRGYAFSSVSEDLSANTFTVIAQPKLSGYTGKRSFRVDNTGNIYTVTGDEAVPGIVTVDPDSGGSSGGGRMY
ncbi:MAG: hypothetical protein AB1629_05420 [Candidatus Omnitrophota bacterium]